MVHPKAIAALTIVMVEGRTWWIKLTCHHQLSTVTTWACSGTAWINIEWDIWGSIGQLEEIQVLAGLWDRGGLARQWIYHLHVGVIALFLSRPHLKISFSKTICKTAPSLDRERLSWSQISFPYQLRRAKQLYLSSLISTRSPTAVPQRWVVCLGTLRSSNTTQDFSKRKISI